MRPLIAVAGLILIGPGCVQAPLPPPEPVISQVRERVAADDPTCRDYTAQATVDGRQQEIVGRACQQSDGSWRIAEGPPGQPTQYQTIYGPPLSYAYGSSYPYPLLSVLRLAALGAADRAELWQLFRFRGSVPSFPPFPP
jgi:hypothetical protein